MCDNYNKYNGSWIMIFSSNFTCTGKIENINENIIILSQARFNVEKLLTNFVGIDSRLIEKIEFINPIKADENKTPSKVLNVFTSETQPPSIKRGGSSSAVNRSLTRKKLSQESFSKLKTASFSDFGTRSRQCSISSSNKQQPLWVDYSPKDMSMDFDFDKHLALFDKDNFKESGNKSTNEGSDSNESAGIKINLSRKYHSNTFNFDAEDFSSYDENNHCKSTLPGGKQRDIFNALQEIGVIPTTENRNGRYYRNPSENYNQQPDLVREITQQLNSDLIGLSGRYPVISVNKITTDFSKFTEYWNLDNNYIFPVFSIKQRDVLFEYASQLGFGSDLIENIVGQTLSEFILKQIGESTRVKTSVKSQSPNIAVLVSKCNASIYAISVARYLLKKNCYLVVFIDDNKTSDINYKVDVEISMFKKLLSEQSANPGYNIITHKIKDLNNKTFDYIISGVESDSCNNRPSTHLQTWCVNQTSHICCINPPSTSYLMWKSAVFIGVPTFSYNNLNIKIDSNINVVCSHSNRKVNLEKTTKKPDGLILLCNIHFPDKVFSFLKLNYCSSFTSSKWLRLYSDNDLYLVE